MEWKKLLKETILTAFLVTLLVGILFSLTGCAGKKIPSGPVGQDPVSSPPPSLKWQNGEWDQILYRALENEGRGLMEFKNDKDYWARFLVAMAKFESNFKENLDFKENFKDRHGNYIISKGLFQLSYESSLGYSCPLNEPNDLHKAFYNINCAVRILNRWVSRDKCISCKKLGKWRGGARYWSVLRYKLDQVKEYADN